METGERWAKGIDALEPRGRVFGVVVCGLEGEKCSLESEGVVGQALNLPQMRRQPTMLLSIHTVKVTCHAA